MSVKKELTKVGHEFQGEAPEKRTLADYINAFLAYESLTHGKNVRRTILVKSDVRKLISYCDESGVDIHSVDYRMATGFVTWLGEQRGLHTHKPYATGTCVRIIAHVKRLFSYLKEQGVVLTNPFIDMPFLRSAKALPKHIAKEQEMKTLLDRLSNFTSGKTLLDWRRAYKMHLLAELQYATGLRIGEIAALRPQDIDTNRGTVQVTANKNGRSRTVFLNDYAREVLHIYLTRMRKSILTWRSNENLLFGSAKYLQREVAAQVCQHAKSCGLPHFTSHSFRHAFGYHMLRAGCDVRYIQEFLGHKSITSTEVYTKVEKEDLARVINQHHPRRFARQATA